MFAESGEKRAAEEAVKMISCFSQEFQSEKSLLGGPDFSASIGALSSVSVLGSGRFSLATSIAAKVEVCSTEAASEPAWVGACDETCEDS